MASLRVRGTRDNPKVYAEYKDPDGTRRTRLLPGCRTKADARKKFAEIQTRIADGLPGMVEDEQPEPAAETMGPLLVTWLEGLANRNAKNDRSRAEAHVMPAWKDVALVDGQKVAAVMRWLEVLKSTAGGGQSQRHALNLLSRFWSWAIELGHAEVNPCRSVTPGKRPTGKIKTDGPWVRDEKMFEALFEALPLPVNLMFWLGNRSGLRPSETRALRMQDFSYLDDGLIVVRGSAGETGIGPLKEDRRGQGKSKKVPAHVDTARVMRAWLKRRKAEGAGPDDLVFVPVIISDRPRTSKWKGIRKEYVQSCWEKARVACGVEDMDFYEATKHSFITRNLEAGVPLDEVSAAVNHSSPVVTKKYYDRYVRTTYSPAIRGVRKSRPRGRRDENAGDDRP